MNRFFKSYLAIWAIMLVLFNVIAFVSVGWTGQEKYTASFWIGYVCIMLAFAGQLACAHFALRSDDLQKTFYNISLLTTSYAGLIATFVCGGTCMLISLLPYWMGAILCAAVLAFSVITVVKASAAVELVAATNEKVKAQTFFIKSLTADAEGLLARAKSEELQAKCKKVYEAVRYSDPMSSDALTSVETEITLRFARLTDAVTADNTEIASALADELLILLRERNNKCKILK